MSATRDVVCCVTHQVTKDLTQITCCDESGGPTDGDGLLLEDGAGFLLLESGDFLLLE